MAMTDEQFNKLPKYAADEIARLRREVDYLKGQIAGLTADPAGALVVWRHLMKDFALPDGVSVSFRHGRTHIECRMNDDGWLVVHGSRAVVMHPQAANAVYIRCETD